MILKKNQKINSKIKQNNDDNKYSKTPTLVTVISSFVICENYDHLDIEKY